MSTNRRKASQVTSLSRHLAQEEIMSKELLLFLIDNEKDLERLPVTDKTRWMFQFKVEQLRERLKHQGW